MANASDLVEPKQAPKNGPQKKAAKKKNPNMKGGWGGRRIAGVTLDGKPSKPQVRYKDGRPVKPSPLKGRKQTKYWSRVPKAKRPQIGAAYLVPGMYFTKVSQIGNAFTFTFTAVPNID